MKKAINDLFLTSFQNMIESAHKTNPKYVGNYSIIIDKLLNTLTVDDVRTFKVYFNDINHDFLDDLVTVENKTEPYSKEEIMNLLPSEQFLIDSPKTFQLWVIKEDNIPEIIFRINKYLLDN